MFPFFLLIIMFVYANRGIPGGEENGERGYMLTFAIAYLRVCFASILLSDSGFIYYFNLFIYL